MDDRRRTISSEEAMIGEGLMRVNNTLTAQRLTKSLSYQGRTRNRSRTKLILSIVSLVLMLGLLVVGGLLLNVLMKYEEPVMGTVLPFLTGMFNGINTFFYASTEAGTYTPLSMQLTVETLNELYKLQHTLGNLDTSGLMDGLSSVLGSLSGVLGDLGNQIGAMFNTIGASLSENLPNLGTSISTGMDSIKSMFGIDSDTMAQMTRNSLETTATQTGAYANLINKVANSTLTDHNINNLVQQAANQGQQTAQLLEGVDKVVSGVSGALSGLAG